MAPDSVPIALLVALPVALLTWSPPALAQPPPTPEPEAVTAPVAQGSTDVPYPPGATGDAVVQLELVVEPDGSVSSATVLEGAEPFADGARGAVLNWRFTPALQGSTAVAARIRAQVEFRQPLPATPPPATARPAAKPTGEAPLDVTVRGHRKEVGQTTLLADDVRALPGAFGDAFRAVEPLPGVSPIASGLPYFYVRGAPPNDNHYSLDGIRVPLLFHVGIAHGVFHPGLIDRVDFFPGGAPARHGGSVGSTIAGHTRDPAATAHGEASLRLIDVGGLLEAPVAGSRGTVLVAGRYGYPGRILAAVTPDIKLDYWDYQARGSWRLTDRDRLTILAFGSHDYLAADSRSSSDELVTTLEEQFVSDVHRIDLRYDRALTDGKLRVALTGGHDRQGAAPSYVRNRSAALRLELEQALSPRLRLRGGVDAQLDRYDLRLDAPQPWQGMVPSSADPPPTNLAAGVHADVVWRLSDRLEIVPGVRVQLFTSSRLEAPGSTARLTRTRPAVDPRLSARVGLTRALAWLTTAGLSHQYPTLRVGDLPAPVVSVPGFALERARLQAALQVSQGIELALPADLVASATGFLSRWSGLTDLTASCFEIMPGMVGPSPDPSQPRPPVPYHCPNNDGVKGRAHGVELLLRRPLSRRLHGHLAYTLSRATREAHFLTLAGSEELVTVPSEGDRTHVLNAVLGLQLGTWRAGVRSVFFTGQPYSNTDGTIPVPPYNGLRQPPFFRLDLRLEKRWSFGKHGALALVIEGQNVTLSKEKAAGLDCRAEANPQMVTTNCTRGTIGPITIPSLGLEAFF
jgi:hypothetical protein